MMAPKDFTAWLADAAKGASVIYHTGNVARDRKAWTDRDGIKHKPIAGLDALAKAIARAAEGGVVALVQRRLAPDQWQYSAIRTAPPVRLRGYSCGRRIVELPAIAINPVAPRRREPRAEPSAGQSWQRSNPYSRGHTASVVDK
jgi:hypothetical protein